MSSPADPDQRTGPSPRKGARYSSLIWIGGITVVVLGSIAALTGSDLLHDMREDRRVARDPHVVGHVLGLRDTGKEHHDEPLMEVTIEFTTLDGRAVHTRTIERVGARDAVRLLSHQEINVWYDASNPADAVIRWRPR